MNPIIIKYFKTAYGELILGSYLDQLCLCDWRYRKMRESLDKRIKSNLKAEFVEGESTVISSAIEQLNEYFAGNRKSFDLPLLLVGTEFQKAVWQELLKVAYGTTESYLGLAQKMDNPKAVRAIASANGANAVAIIIPCHRIIGSNGELVGYAGGLSAKKKLLELESDISLQQSSLF